MKKNKRIINFLRFTKLKRFDRNSVRKVICESYTILKFCIDFYQLNSVNRSNFNRYCNFFFLLTKQNTHKNYLTISFRQSKSLYCMISQEQ